jgi:biotin operon repressor
VAFAGLHAGIDQAYLTAYYHYLAASAVGDEHGAQHAVTHAYDLLAASIEGLESVEIERAFDVPEHAAIVEAWARFQPVMATATLPRLDAPTGRALEPDEQVVVEWTVAGPADRHIADRAERRRYRLRRLMAEASEQGGSPRIDDLADALGVSVATVRRDISLLRDLGFVVRTRGTRGNPA